MAETLHTEKELLAQIAAGDEHAFRQLFYAWHNKLGAYVYGWTKSMTVTEEIVQDVFLKIWLKREALTKVDHFENYLYILSRNHTFNALRQVARERTQRQQWLHSNQPPAPPDLDNLDPDYIPLVEAAIEQLPEQQRKVFALKFHQGLKYEDIAQQMQISPETARKHMQAAKKFVLQYVELNLPILLLILSTPLNFS